MSDPRVRSAGESYSPAPSVRDGVAPDELLAGLTDPTETTFHRALGRVSTRGNDPAAVASLLEAFLDALVGESRLTDRTRADRLTAVLRRLDPPLDVLTALALAARSRPAGIRMAVAQVLPAAQRALLASTNDSAATIGGAVLRDVAPPAPSESSPVGKIVDSAAQGARHVESRSIDGALDSDGTIAMVAILSRPDLQEANKRLLHENGFAAVPWDSVARLREELSTNSDVCACVVDGSILAELNEEAQRELFSFLGGYSSFVWIRIQDQGLRLSFPEIRELVKQARCARGVVPHVSSQSDSMLRPGELADFRRSAETLQASAGTSFLPGELDESQVRVLVAAVREYWNAHELGTDVQVRVLETRFISGGRSGAVLVRIRVNATGQPLIAKVGPTDWITAESRRLRTFVEQWERAVHPETFLHGASGVILFPLIADEHNRNAPADTLEERLVGIWNDQVMGSIDGIRPEIWESQLVARRSDMIEALRVLTTTLASLNERRPPATASPDNFPPYGNPSIGALERLHTEGVQWRFNDDVQDARARAQARLERLRVHAIVHGDMHLRNVLLRDDRSATLIDFASCGPGHPAVDLARLDVVLFTDGMRQLVAEERCVAFQRALSLERVPASTLHEAFPDLLACHVNIVCADGAVLARDAGINVLQGFNASYDDYLAAKYLIASQALHVMGRSTAMARAVVEALTPAILAWRAA